MSEIRVDKIVSSTGSGAVELTQGFTIPSGVDAQAPYASVAGIATYATTAGVSTVAQGLTGNPNITVGSLNASSGTVSGNLTVLGVLTYEDVANVDSIGIATARSGLRITGGGLDVVGVSTFNAQVTSTSSVTATCFIRSGGTSSQFLKADGSTDSNTYLTSSSSLNATCLTSGTVPVNQLGSSGTRNSSTYLRGDNTWATITPSPIAVCCVSNFLSCNTCAPNIDTKSLPDSNFFVGFNAGACLTSGRDNTFLGSQAGCRNTTGSDNNFLGYGAGSNNTTGSFNNFIGHYAGRCNTTGCNNNFIGRFAGRGNTTGSHNIYVGYRSACFGTGGYSNVFIGRDTGRYNTTGDNNTFIGSCSGYTVGRGCNNSFFGFNSGCLITGSCNVVIGSFNGTSYRNCCNHIFLSDGAGNNRFQINNSGAFGLAGANYGTSGQVLTSNGTGSAPSWQAAGGATVFCISGNSTIYSCNAGACGSNNFYVGCSAGHSGSGSPQHTIAIGQESGRYGGYKGANHEYNIFFGFKAGQYRSGGCDNFFAGKCAGRSGFNDRNATTGCANIAIGGFAGACLTTGSHNFFAGCSAGRCNTTGCNNIFFGSFAGYYTTTGNCNTFIGDNSGRSNTIGSHNVFIGRYAGGCMTGGNTTGCNNIAIGCASGMDGLYNFATTGGSNIIVMGNNSHTAAYVKVAWTTGSDARDKTNIIPIPVGRDFLKQLNPVQYQWKDRETDEVTVEKPNYGFLAQDILALEDAPTIIVDDHDPDHLKVRESMIVPVLVKTVQELIEEVDALKEEIRILKGE
jgi:hypothetical protein